MSMDETVDEQNAFLSTVEVTLRYHPMTHHTFLAIVCLNTVFDDYLSIVSITYLLPITD